MRAASRPLRWVPSYFGQSRLRFGLLIALLGCLAAGGLVVGMALLTTPKPETVTIYACFRGQRVVWWDAERPDQCPPGSELVVDPNVEIRDPDRSFGHRLTVVLRRWLSIPGVMVVLSVACLGWLWAGWKLAGSVSVSWLLVPTLLLVAATCVAGPGHWFAKEPFEGPSVIPLGSNDAITVLDLVGFALTTLSFALAFRLTSTSWQRHPSDG